MPDFKLVRPCPHCPFRTDCLEGWLSRGRATEIAQSLQRDSTFACHETTEAGGSDGPEQHCAGALLVLEAEGRMPQLARVAGRVGLYDPDRLDRSAPTFGSLAEFVEHHEGAVSEPCDVAEPGCLAPAGWLEGGNVVSNFRVDEAADVRECESCGSSCCSACAGHGGRVRICPDCMVDENEEGNDG